MGAANEALAKAYQEQWIPGTPNAKNCSGFLKSAGKRIGFFMPDGRADEIIQHLERSQEWEMLGRGEAGLKKAISYAKGGRLVIVGATSHDYGQASGHVAILLPKTGGPYGAPLVYCGSDGSVSSAGTKSIRDVWNPHKLQVLRYFLHRSALLRGYD